MAINVRTDQKHKVTMYVMRNGHYTTIYFFFVCFQIPLLSWRQVIQELDYPEFHVPSREGLQLLFTACHRGLMEIFPVDVLYRTWTNTEGQVSHSDFVF